MIAWAAEELQYADLGDARLNKRLVKIVEDLAAYPNEARSRSNGEMVRY